MDSMPFTKVGQATTLQETDASAAPKQETQTELETETCEVCNKADSGLLFCDRCIEASAVYHPLCLLFLPDSNERICDTCSKKQKHSGETLQTPTLVPPPKKTVNAAPLNGGNTDRSLTHSMSGDPPRGPVKDAWDDASTSTSSSSSSSIQPYSPKFKSRATRPQHAPPNLQKTDIDAPKSTQRQTRAAKRAAAKDTDESDDSNPSK